MQRCLLKEWLLRVTTQGRARSSVNGMSNVPAGGDAAEGPRWYEIEVGAVLDPHWAAWFEGMDITVLDQQITRISGPVADEAALHGILDRIGDLGIPLLLVRRLPP